MCRRVCGQSAEDKRCENSASLYRVQQARIVWALAPGAAPSAPNAAIADRLSRRCTDDPGRGAAEFSVSTSSRLSSLRGCKLGWPRRWHASYMVPDRCSAIRCLSFDKRSFLVSRREVGEEGLAAAPGAPAGAGTVADSCMAAMVTQVSDTPSARLAACRPLQSAISAERHALAGASTPSLTLACVSMRPMHAASSWGPTVCLLHAARGGSTLHSTNWGT